MRRLWVSIRESDWATFDWMFETPEGNLVAFGNVDGAFNRKLGPIIQMIGEELGDKGDAALPAPADAANSKSDENQKSESESEVHSP